MYVWGLVALLLMRVRAALLAVPKSPVICVFPLAKTLNSDDVANAAVEELTLNTV